LEWTANSILQFLLNGLPENETEHKEWTKSFRENQTEGI
jgi:hypothetical protein